MPDDQISIFILSANEIEREGLRRIVIENGFSVSAVHKMPLDPEITLQLEGTKGVPVLLVDQTMNDEGLRYVRELRARWPNCKIIVMSSQCESRLVINAFQAGVDGFIGKHISCASLTEMIKLVALGEKIVPYQVVLDLPCPTSIGEPTDYRPDSSGARLSERQIDILRGLARGEPNKVISRRLAITEATVKVHVKSILRRIGVANRTQAAVWAIEVGLLAEVTEAETPGHDDLRGGVTKSFGRNGSCLA